jgi:hypothetical protein
MAAGTGSFGYVAACPTPNSDGTCMYITGATYAGVSTTSLATSGTGITAVSPNSEYTASQFTAPSTTGAATGQVSARVVGWGIRIRYKGTESNRGGTITAFEHPEHCSVIGETLASILSFENAERHDVPEDGSWVSICYVPKFPWEYEYSGQFLGWEVEGDTTIIPPYLCLLVESPTTTAQLFDLEWFADFEFLGSGVRGKTPSHNDPIGHNLVVSAVGNSGGGQIVQKKPEGKPSFVEARSPSASAAVSPSGDSWGDKLWGYFSNNATKVLDFGLAKGGQYLDKYLGM